MGKKKTGGSNKGTTKIKKTSGGMRRCIRAKRALMRITMKIARWERNKDNPEKVSKWDRKQKPRLRPRHNEWNTEGLKKHAAILQKIVDKGRKVAA